jgi:hypothetical protein
MRDCFFGQGLPYRNAVSFAAVAINRYYQVLQVYGTEGSAELRYALGNVARADIHWGVDTGFDTGVEADVAMTNTAVVEVHRSEKTDDRQYDLWLNVGVPGATITWKHKEQFDTGVHSSVGLNTSGVFMEVHRHPTRDELFYNLGITDGTGMSWGEKGASLCAGANPSIALGVNEEFILTYEEWPNIYARHGWTDGKQLFSLSGPVLVAFGLHPSVAFPDSGFVAFTFSDWDDASRKTPGGHVHQTTGEVVSGVIQLQADRSDIRFDAGDLSSVAASGGVAVEMHVSGGSSYFSTSMIYDRSTWMQVGLPSSGTRPLRQLTIPASHDAGMYKGSWENLWPVTEWTITQDRSIGKQLEAGIRWFDLRPIWSYGDLYVQHDGWLGPTMSEVLSDIQEFLGQGRRELIILTFSHFRDEWTSENYGALVGMIQLYCKDYLFLSAFLPKGKRLADLTLQDYIGSRATVLVVVDKNWAIETPVDGFWVYRNCPLPGNGGDGMGDLRVFDHYAKTESFDAMKQDQLGKFSNYTGMCADQSKNDLFLLSWTLTPKKSVSSTPVEALAETANRQLATSLAAIPPKNQYGYPINLIYVDYVEYARVTDVAIYQND